MTPTAVTYPEPRYDNPSSKATSRRQFIKGVIASGAAVSSAGYLFSLAGCSREQGAAGGIERMLTLNVNGQMRTVDVLPNETLAMTLRYKLGLTGTKLGCDRGECGACTVLLDDVTSYSCSTLTHAVRNRAIMTIEGLEGANGELHKVQQAMIDELGPQCGFCTPGQIMSAVALLKSESATDARRGASRVVGQSLPVRCIRPLLERGDARGRSGRAFEPGLKRRVTTKV